MTNDLKTLEEREKDLEEQRSQLKAKIDQSAYIKSRQKIRKWIRFLHEIMRLPDSSTYQSINQIFQDYERRLRTNNKKENK